MARFVGGPLDGLEIAVSDDIRRVDAPVIPPTLMTLRRKPRKKQPSYQTAIYQRTRGDTFVLVRVE